MYTTDNIFPVLPIKHLVNQDREQTMTHKMVTGTDPSVSNLHALLCLCVVRKANEHVDTKVLKMYHQPQQGLCGIIVVIPHHQKVYLIYVLSTWTIVSLHEVVFGEKHSSVLELRSCPFLEALVVGPAVLYIL